jgi:VIT1/CCC1 family predicted Fe2+/Mn2+ transporter
MNFNFFKDRVYVRNLVYGVEDGIVSTVGLLAGVAIAGISESTLILTGSIMITVEALSAAAGSYLSEQSVEEDFTTHSSEKKSIEGGLVMFAAHFIAGFIPLLPYLVIDISGAFSSSIALSFAALFILGLWSGRRGNHIWKSAWRMAIVGGLAIVVGAIVGRIIH